MTEQRFAAVEAMLANHEARISAAEQHQDTFYSRVVVPLQADMKALQASLDRLRDKLAEQQARLAYIIGGAAVASALIGAGTGSVVSAMFGGG